jgi:hypothetical protein
MRHHDREFVSVTDDGLTLQEKGSDVSVKREDVVRVSTASGARRGEHAVIGLVVGALAGAGIGAAVGSRSKLGRTLGGHWCAGWRRNWCYGRSDSGGGDPRPDHPLPRGPCRRRALDEIELNGVISTSDRRSKMEEQYASNCFASCGS